MTSQTIPQLRRLADTHHKHARNCKKAPDACMVCVAAIRWFRELPPETLAHVLADYGNPVKG